MANAVEASQLIVPEENVVNEEVPPVEESDEPQVPQEGEVEEDASEEKIEKALDDDQDRRNPQYIPKGGAFYEHDNRTSLEDVENKDPQENDKKKKSWKESKESERWLHDCYKESEQLPKSTDEIIQTYGYDIRNEDAPPRARRRRKYGRGPDKYERSWEDEQAYLVKQNNIGRRGRKKQFGKDEFPPLPNQKPDSGLTKSGQKSPNWKRDDEDSGKSRNGKLNGNDKPSGVPQPNRGDHVGHHSSMPGYHSNKKNYNQSIKKMNDDDIKPFRNDGGKWKNQGNVDDISKPMKNQIVRQNDPSFKRSTDSNKSSTKDSDISQITDGLSQMSFHNKQGNMREVRPKSSNDLDDGKMGEQDVDSPANRQNPKRYSKIRKGFTGIFPPEEVTDLDQAEISKLQHQEQQKNQHLNLTQPLNIPNVIRRYAGTYSDFVPGNGNYLGARPIMSGIPQQGMSPQGMHQQTLSPQGIPQQALSPQVTGLQAIELQQGFVQPMYIDHHYTSDVVGPFTGYPPYSGNQTGDVYQPSGGITYYSTECQSSSQMRRPPPARRPKAAIPIVPPSE